MGHPYRTNPPGTGRKSFLLRIDPQLFAAMQKWASDDLRSLNGQIEFVLREALDKAGRLPRAKKVVGGKP